MRKKIIITSVIALIFILMAFRLFLNKQTINENNKVADRSNISVAVTAEPVQLLPLGTTLNANAVLEAYADADVTSLVQGKISSLNFELGKMVSKGQVLGNVEVRLRELNLQSTELAVGKLEKDFARSQDQLQSDLDARIKELSFQSNEKTFAKLEQDYTRNQDLLKGGAMTEAAFNDFKLQYENSKIQLEQVRQQLADGQATRDARFRDVKYNYENSKLQAEQLKQQIADSRFVAPISGVIVSKNFQEGEFVNVGMSVATIVDISKLKAVLTVNEKDVYSLLNNQKAVVVCDVFPNQEFEGTVSFVSPKGDENHNYKVEVILSNSKTVQLKAGSYVKVSFQLGDRGEVLQIPKMALVEGVGNPYIYLAMNGKAVSRKITVGRELGENIEVTSGLAKGDMVITSGQINLTEGSKIEMVK